MLENYDLLFSVDTSNRGSHKNDSNEYFPYEATPYPHIKHLFSAHPLKPSDHLIDIGSGKGRLLFYVNYYFNSTVTGIEINEHLHHIAKQNKLNYFQTFRQKNRTISLVNGSAEHYQIPRTANVFYFFQSFAIDVFQNMIARIIHSAQNYPREISLILYYPGAEYLTYLHNQTGFHLVNSVNIPVISQLNPQECFQIYRLTKI